MIPKTFYCLIMSFKRVIITLIIISYTMAFDACMMKEDFHSINYPS